MIFLRQSFLFVLIPFRAFSVGAVDSDDLDVYLTPQRQKKNVRSLFGSVERGLNTVKQILTPKRINSNKPRKTWVKQNIRKCSWRSQSNRFVEF